MKFHPLRNALALLALGCFATVFAQTKPALEPLPEPPPPPPGLIDDATLEPQVTIRKQGEDKVEEFRINGRLYMIKVTPAHGKPYYLVDRTGTGTFAPVDAAIVDKGMSVPMWVIHTF
ncbi:DUF2782 domain-containing protein [Sulfuricystis multivorans]|uniref:DUF2782 domain-containing protein n=1 Tax=Sulfuricystis multivorans TaxID=2211108 RepID=UPI000F821A7D|nr:DUF2782 domain-containing protein [Sulfuricystis multivorans]